MTITNIMEYEAASEEKRAVWLGERIFNAIAIDGQNIIYGRKSLTKSIRQFVYWLHSPEGIDAVERAMVERGHDVRYTRFSPGDVHKYEVIVRVDSAKPEDYLDEFTFYNVTAKTKSEAQQHAAAKALLGGA